MPAATTGPVRLARASVVAATTVALALVAHATGGGGTPPATVLVPLAAVMLAAAVPFTGRRIGSLRSIVLLGFGQLALHSAFGLVNGMGCAPTGMVGHAHVTQAVHAACEAPTSHAGAGSAGHAMLALHVVATLLVAVLIAATDRAIGWIVTWLSPLVALLSPVTLPASALLPVKLEARRAVGRRDVGVVPLRGPPTSPAHVTLAA